MTFMFDLCDKPYIYGGVVLTRHFYNKPFFFGSILMCQRGASLFDDMVHGDITYGSNHFTRAICVNGFV